ncbi:TPM domain-containing protein [Gardnerella vaginalis]|uniref:TPM domain-containing protein n=1 Tax=Gardnerella vaginalis TaxID=2702 RepID=UPI0002FB5FE7|nr:TPM domain-containing protein [Gardnerella vaginalis]
MPSRKFVKDFFINVVKGLSAFVIIVFFSESVLFPTTAFANDGLSKADSQNKSTKNLGIVATDSITDTENLLGDSVTKVSDMISTTKKQTGVSVKLLYLSNFTGNKNPSKWASDLLTSTNPDRNTVLLAVATHDGKLVVAVSSNSDEWLKRKTTVDLLSDAAYRPLISSQGADWSQSAIMLMKQIARSKKTSVTSRTSVVSTIVMVVIIVALFVLVALILWRRNYILKQVSLGLRRAKRRHAVRK